MYKYKYYQAFSLIEICVLIMILSSLFFYIAPYYQNIQQYQQTILAKQELLNFLQLTMQNIKYTNESWEIFIHKDGYSSAISIQPTKNTKCNLLVDKNCIAKIYSYVPKYGQIYAKKYFPKNISVINSIRNSLMPTCLKFKIFEESYIFLFSSYGRIRVDDLKQSTNYISKCSEL